MAVLVTADRIVVGAQFQSGASQRRDALPAMVKADIQAAVAAIDDWIVANQASFNAALPLPARTSLTPAQKSELFALVLRRRFESGA